MANLKEVKERINSVVSTQQITKAMKMVSAAKLRRAQDKIVQMRPYSQKLTNILNNVSAASEGASDIVFAEKRDVKKVLIVPVTSDKGLCGAFNTNVIKATNAAIKDQFAGKEITILPLGKKAYETFKKREFSVINDFYQVFLDVSFDNVRAAAEYAMNGFIAGDYDQVVLVFNEFKNVATQIIRTEQFLPMAKEEGADEVKAAESDYIMEPSRSYIIEELVPTSLKIQFYKAVLESNASEHGARMTAMDKATENAGELLKELRLMYNRTRQAAITNEILEIVAGANALGGN
ncbi:ATP synthase F1 subunit gamma [Algoriphagus zhangzhouensis]|uniref:ATP synthase gamma chain n=1 Tax=Algoriphagus zhangzhouensis TaxID=1073327 RepID=A0A1M7ZFV2_9BACT|nr:ATP synthase F1 subunit gamma [Algoriphagus zhangzhouensis]TDY44952.1 ATP synthase F1 subcomplex gamma subunit [Algoriphagus zhangzhouensis]SHO63757.1 F-type H+-transporting ATPase subunit gamma [Algoriphagus zhangzhouensis]